MYTNMIPFQYNLSKEYHEGLSKEEISRLAGLLCKAGNKICFKYEREHFHCSLCDDKTEVKRSRLIRYFKDTHFNIKHSPQLKDGLVSIGCKKGDHCKTSVQTSNYHYYCPGSFIKIEKWMTMLRAESTKQH